MHYYTSMNNETNMEYALIMTGNLPKVGDTIKDVILRPNAYGIQTIKVWVKVLAIEALDSRSFFNGKEFQQFKVTLKR